MLRHGSASRLWDAVSISPPWRQQQGQRPDRSQKVSQHISVLLSHLHLWRYQPRSDSNANGKRTCTRTMWSIIKYYEVTSAKTFHNLDILRRKVDAGTLSLWHRLTLSWFCIAKPQFEASEQTPYIHPWHIQFQRHLAAVLRLFQNISNTSSIDLANDSLCTYTHSLRVRGCVQGTQSNWSFSTQHLWWKTHAQLIWYIIWVPLIVLTCADRATNFFGQLELMLNHD